MHGVVYLVGAGPGDPELLTIKAFKVLMSADVVLYDRLVSDDILKMVNPGAMRIYVGKEVGQSHMQRKIVDLMVEYALRGCNVVRLKGGDPMVFGRGAEEWLVLAERGIHVEVVPGVSSCIAAPELAGIPLTLRGLSRGFCVLSGRTLENSPPELRPYAHVDTLVILMSVGTRQNIARILIKLGRNPEEPVAFVERASTPTQRISVYTLKDVADGVTEVEAPAVWIVGEVVNVRRSLLKSSAEVKV